MEREQIIKALESCTSGRKSNGDIPCLECPYNECNVVGGTSERQISGTCQGWLMKDALSLIKELTEENDRLSTALAEYEHKTNIRISEEYVHNEAYEELREENEKLTINMNAYGLTAKRLAEENAEQDKAIINALNRIKEVRRETKADTVKKMQERVKEKIHKSVYQYWNENDGGYYLAEDVDDDIDQIAKEMLEENK